MLRPSTSTKSLLAKTSSNPLELIAQSCASSLATSSPGTSRSASGRTLNPERRISSGVSTYTAAAALAICSSFLDTVVTRILINCSISIAPSSDAFNSFDASGCPSALGVAAIRTAKPAKQPRAQNSKPKLQLLLPEDVVTRINPNPSESLKNGVKPYRDRPPG